MIPVPREVLESVRDKLVNIHNAMSATYLIKLDAHRAITAIDKILEKNDGR